MATLTTLEQVLSLVPAGPRIIIGIVGPPGAGKSTIAAELVSLLGSRAALLPMDGFHLPQAELRRLGRRDRMGAPDTFDVDGFVATLTALRSGDSVLAPGFDRVSEEAIPDAIEISAGTRVVVVEGNYLLLETGGWERAAPLLDATFYVELEGGIRLERLIARHEQFGKSPADARAWALGPDESNARTIEATARHADHVIRLG